MPRARQRRVQVDEDADEPAADAPATELEDVVDASAASDAGGSSRRRQMADIARNRAEFFARGGGIGTGVAAAQMDQPEEEEEAAAPQQWPGPWSTARDLLRGRDAARAAREGGDAPAAASSALAASSASKGASIPVPDDAANVADFAPSWTPQVDWKSSLSDTLQANGDETASSAARGGRVRQPMAVAGPSGVRLDVPPLAVLCMEALIAYLKDVEGLGPLGPAARRQLAAAVCRARAMDNHAFALFANVEADEVHIPDCAGVDEAAMCDAFAACSGLVVVSLQHAGRGFTDRTASALADSCGATLQQLSLAGAYTLTDAGLTALLSRLPVLRALSLKNCPLLTGERWVAQLHAFAPQLCELHLNACNITADVLFGAAATSAGTKRPAAAASLSRAASGSKKARKVVSDYALDDDEEAALQEAIALSFQTEAPPPAAAAPASTSAGGIFALQGLTSLTLAHMAVTSVTDKVLLALAQSLAPQLESFRLIRVPGIKQATMTALARAFTNRLQVLELDSITSLQDDAVYELARKLRGLHELHLNRCPHVSNTALVTLIHASCDRVRSVSLCGMPGMRDEVLVALARGAASSLVKLDVSMSRGFNDDGMGQLVDACPHLTRLTVWGCTQLTGRFFLRHVRAASAAAAAAKFAHLRVYGRPGDVMCAPEYDD